MLISVLLSSSYVWRPIEQSQVREKIELSLKTQNLCGNNAIKTYFLASLSQASGTFKISDSSVQGKGTYYMSNSSAEIGLKLVIGMPSHTSKDKATAIITSLPASKVSPSGLPVKSKAKRPENFLTLKGKQEKEMNP